MGLIADIEALFAPAEKAGAYVLGALDGDRAISSAPPLIPSVVVDFSQTPFSDSTVAYASKLIREVRGDWLYVAPDSVSGAMGTLGGGNIPKVVSPLTFPNSTVANENSANAASGDGQLVNLAPGTLIRANIDGLRVYGSYVLAPINTFRCATNTANGLPPYTTAPILKIFFGTGQCPFVETPQGPSTLPIAYQGTLAQGSTTVYVGTPINCMAGQIVDASCSMYLSSTSFATLIPYLLFLEGNDVTGSRSIGGAGSFQVYPDFSNVANSAGVAEQLLTASWRNVRVPKGVMGAQVCVNPQAISATVTLTDWHLRLS
jgi:hypothetical protein